MATLYVLWYDPSNALTFTDSETAVDSHLAAEAFYRTPNVVGTWTLKTCDNSTCSGTVYDTKTIKIVTPTTAALSDLATAVADFAPKSALQKLVKQIQGYVDDNNTKKACKSFNGFASRVKGMVKVKKLSSAEAAELNQLAQAVESALGC